MKKKIKLFTLILLGSFTVISCGEDGLDGIDGHNEKTTLFTTRAKVTFPNNGFAHVSTFDVITNRLFSTNNQNNTIEIIDISNVSTPIISIDFIDMSSYGSDIKSVSCTNGFLAIAVEATTKTDNGTIVIFETSDLTTPYYIANVGASPTMVTFTPDGNYILSANEGKPSDDYQIDPLGSISLIDVLNKTEQTIDFTTFNTNEADLEKNGFRVFGPAGVNLNSKADLATDIEPEYITLSDDSSTAYITLQENNGIAKFDIATATFDTIYPLGTKNLSTSYYDLSNNDRNVGNFQSWPILNFYQPNNIDFFTSNGNEYIITANEGEIRDLPSYSEKSSLSDLTINLNSPLFGIGELNITDDASKTQYIDWLKEDQNIGALKVTKANGSEDGGISYDRFFGFGGRSFSIWNTSGKLVYDSGNELTLRTYNLGSYPDNNSNEKGIEPKSIKVFTSEDQNFAAIGLEGNGDVLIYNITDVYNPLFVQRLINTSPEDLLVIDADDSPNEKTLLIVSNKNSTLNIYSK